MTMDTAVPSQMLVRLSEKQSSVYLLVLFIKLAILVDHTPLFPNVGTIS